LESGTSNPGSNQSQVQEKTGSPGKGRYSVLRTYRWLFIASIILGLMVVILAGVFARPYVFMGSKIDPPAPVLDFSLVDQNGDIFKLREQRGKVVLIFFGYTNCPDICPTTLAEFKLIREKLKEKAKDVEFVFITIDPERDTKERLAAYLPVFGDGILGLTGSNTDLQPIWDEFGVVRQKVNSNSAVGYLMEHSTRTYGIDKNGNIRVTYFFGTAVDSIVQDIQYLLGEGSGDL
jgi:protein SCO1